MVMQGKQEERGVYPPFTEDYRFTGPHVAISCTVDFDAAQGEWRATSSDVGHGVFIGTGESMDAAALACFTAWMTRQRGWFKPHEYVMKSGKVLTDADIEALADEAERGYDVSHLRRQGGE